MFQKKKTAKKEKVVPETPKPQEIEELKEAVEGEEVPEETQEEVPQETPEPVDAELTEEQVKEWMRNIATVLNDQERRISNIEHHLRLDFPQ